MSVDVPVSLSFVLILVWMNFHMMAAST